MARCNFNKIKDYDSWWITCLVAEDSLTEQSDIYDWVFDNGTLRAGQNPVVRNTMWELTFTADSKRAMEFKLRFS